MTGPITRAILPSGATHDDPSEDLLFLLFDDVASGREQFLIVERVATPTYFIQTIPAEDDPDAWHVEHREGDASRHYAARVDDLRTAHAVVTGWTFGQKGWRGGLAWERVTF